MTSVPPVTAAIIAAIAALIGAFIGFISTYLVAHKNLKKEVSLKVAEYRIDWMNRLGDEISDFIEKITLMSMSDEKTNNELTAQINRAATKIDLSMNDKDEHYDELKSCMSALMAHAAKKRGQEIPECSSSEYATLRTEMIAVSKKILKNEWRRTKRHLREDTILVSALKSDSDAASRYIFG